MEMISFIPLFLDFSGGEFLLIAVVFLMFFGSKSIPGIARTLGKIMREFRDAAGSVQREIQESANLNLKDFDLNEQPRSFNSNSSATPQGSRPLPEQPKAELPETVKNAGVETQGGTGNNSNNA